MNTLLVENSIKYHGKELFDLIAQKNDHNPDQNSSNEIKYLDENNQVKVLSHSDLELQQNNNDQFLRNRLLAFISKKSDILFNVTEFPLRLNTDENDVIFLGSVDDTKDDKKELLNQVSDSEMSDFDIPPFETFMGIHSSARREHLMNYINRGDIVIGCIGDINYKGLVMQMICFDSDKRRDISHIKLNLFCPYQNAIRSIQSKSKSRSDKSDLESHFYRNNFLRCVVVNLDKQNDVCEVSLEWSEEFPNKNSIRLGQVEPETLPAYLKNIQDFQYDRFSFGKSLNQQKGFNNPACIKLFGKKLGVNFESTFSLMNALNRKEIKKEEMADQLLKRQNTNIALEHVHKGVKLFKDGNLQDAILNYQKALQLDEECVEAFVARGALNANQGEYLKAIEDFEKALKIDVSHSNARKYLKEVFLAYSVKLEKSEKLEEAKAYLKKAIEIDPENEVIKTKLSDLDNKIDCLYSRNRYGPSLPSITEKNKQKKRSPSPESYSNDKAIKLSVNESKNNKISLHNERRQDDRRNSSHYENNKNDKFHKDKKTNKKSDRSDDDEDLEAFYNQLKQKKASMGKKK